MTLSVHQVDADNDEFFAVQQRALGSLPNWRPSPLSWEKSLLDPAKNPLFDHIELARFVATRDDVAIGRVTAVVDQRDDTLASFGFFDVVDDVEAGAALIAAATDWCAERGRTRIRGPIDLWAVCSAGIPTAGFDLANTFALHHGAPHYEEAVRAAGLLPAAQIYSWQFGARPLPAPAVGIARATLANRAISIVDFDPTSREHWAIAQELYTSCYADGDWFAPMSLEELRLIAHSYVEAAVSFLVLVRGTPAGMSIGLRNVVESSVRIGDMIPPEPIQRVLRPGRRPHSFRQWLFAVAPQFRGAALGHLSTAMYVTLRNRAEAAGLERGEAAWTSGLDKHLTAGFTAVGARRDKTYQIFEGRILTSET